MSTIFADGAVIPAAPSVRTPRGVASVCALAWVFMVVGKVTGLDRYLHHDVLLESGTFTAAALGLYVAGWLVMVGAMMLPATPPIPSRVATGPFLGGFAAVWAVGGCVLLGLDMSLHQVVDGVPALAARPWLVTVALLGATGLVQLAKSTRRPLAAPAPSSPSSAFLVGRNHGLHCLRADGPLMLVMFAFAGDLVWMALLTLVMVAERSPRIGRHVTVLTGVALLAAAAVAALAGLAR